MKKLSSARLLRMAPRPPNPQCKTVIASHNRIVSAATTWDAKAGTRPAVPGWCSRPWRRPRPIISPLTSAIRWPAIRTRKCPAILPTTMPPSGLWSPTLTVFRHWRKRNRDKNHDAADSQGVAGLRGRFVLIARRVEQYDRLRLQVPLPPACADDGFDFPRQSRHVARPQLASLAHNVLSADYRVGGHNHGPPVVGRDTAFAQLARAPRHGPSSQELRECGA